MFRAEQKWWNGSPLSVAKETLQTGWVSPEVSKTEAIATSAFVLVVVAAGTLYLKFARSSGRG